MGNLTAGNKRAVVIPSHMTLFFFNFMTEKAIKGQKSYLENFKKVLCSMSEAKISAFYFFNLFFFKAYAKTNLINIKS